MQIVSINVGLPTTRRYGEREYYTGGDKTPVTSARLRTRNFDGDGQADLVHHGSPDQAVLVFAQDHYPHWEAVLGRPLRAGAFSENLTVAGATETAVCIGDIFRAGEALLQVTQPRQPCGKLAYKLGEPQLVEWLIAHGQGGFYLRVLEEGWVTVGDPFDLVEPHPDRITVATVNDLIYGRVTDRSLLARLLAVPEFSAASRQSLSKKLEQWQATTSG